jgi:hypothetical protein
MLFKEYKQNFKINKWQWTDFDAHIGWLNLIFISFMILYLYKRFDDFETKDEVLTDFKN